MRPRVMIVEDSATSAAQIGSVLSDHGYTICAVFSSGEESVEHVAEYKPDVILMDIELGDGIDGIESAKKIHEHHNIPIVYLTAHSEGDTLVSCRSKPALRIYNKTGT